MNTYACLGPPLAVYKHLLDQHGNNANRIIAELKSHDKQPVLIGSISDMRDLYTSETLFRASGSVYEFHVWNTDAQEPEVEVYPDASWLTIMQSPKMQPGAIQETDQMFARLTSDHESTDNYVQMPALWRGLEHRIIAQVLTSNELPDLHEGHAILRPEYLAIDPFLLMRLAPHHADVKTSDQAMKSKAAIDTRPVPANVVQLINKQKDT